MIDDTELMRRAYPHDPSVTAQIKLALEGVAVYSDIATSHSVKAQERDESDPDYQLATKYFAMRSENMEAIHTQLDTLVERCERLRRGLVYMLNRHPQMRTSTTMIRLLAAGDLTADLTSHPCPEAGKQEGRST